MNDPTMEPDPISCDSCGEIMEIVGDYDYKCPVCGYEYCTEPDWDSMYGGKDYD